MYLMLVAVVIIEEVYVNLARREILIVPLHPLQRKVLDAKSSLACASSLLLESSQENANLLRFKTLSEGDEDTARKMIIVSLWYIQTNPSNRPSMSKMVDMLEGSLDSLQIPPKPYLSSPPRSPIDSSTVMMSMQYDSTH
ncbi:leaf rust 10 disease-resistance locus receptor-like protein kinase-like 2.2 [Quercus suber]|uniref:Leaf rust 10 disease-resistance locus receptor-like protein kinase-like 2.2 n=1 Tax=Quercus suber TaxID=58331 RepID=A0AAW0KCC9_QUESU